MAEDYPADVTRIQAIIRAHGYPCSRRDAEAYWQRFSDSMAAGWLILYDEDEAIWQTIQLYVKEENQ